MVGIEEELDLSLSTEQRDLLVRVMSNYLGDLRIEIADTDSYDFKQSLKGDEQAARLIVRQLEAAAAAVPTEPHNEAATRVEQRMIVTGAWSVDSEASQVEFTARTLWGLVPVHGQFDEVSGAADVDCEGVASVRLTVDAASVDTKLAKRDAHLRSGEFLDAERHPSIEVAVQHAGVGSRQTVAASGHMTLRGRTHPVSIEGAITCSPDGQRVEVDASLVVDRKAIGMGSGLLGMVGRKIRGRAYLVFHVDPATAAAATQARSRGGG